MKPNATVQATIDRLATDFDEGTYEGYTSNVNVLPVFWFKSISQLTARERGYMVGRELRLQEMGLKL